MEYEIIVSIPEDMYRNFTDDIKITRCEDCQKYNKYDKKCNVWNHEVQRRDYCSRAERKPVRSAKDLAEVVRCKDCKWYKEMVTGWCDIGRVGHVDADYYCAYGERKES